MKIRSAPKRPNLRASRRKSVIRTVFSKYSTTPARKIRRNYALRRREDAKTAHADPAQISSSASDANAAPHKARFGRGAGWKGRFPVFRGRQRTDAGARARFRKVILAIILSFSNCIPKRSANANISTVRAAVSFSSTAKEVGNVFGACWKMKRGKNLVSMQRKFVGNSFHTLICLKGLKNAEMRAPFVTVNFPFSETAPPPEYEWGCAAPLSAATLPCSLRKAEFLASAGDAAALNALFAGCARPDPASRARRQRICRKLLRARGNLADHKRSAKRKRIVQPRLGCRAL